MICLRHYIKSDRNFLIEHNKKYSMEIEKNIAESDVLIGWHKSYEKNFIWLASRKSDKDIRITVVENIENRTAYIDLEDELLDSEVSFANLPDENKVIVSLTAGQDGSQDFCLEFLKHKLIIIHKFPKNLTYTFSISKDESLLVDFYTSEFYKISNNDFQIKFGKTYSVFEDDAISNVWRVSDSFGIFCTTEGRWYVFELNTLSLIDELVIENDKDDCYRNCCGINTLYQTRDELIFRRYDYKNGKEEIDWISVDKIYLEKVIREKDSNNQKYINAVKLEEIPWHRLPTTYGRATLFPQYFEVLKTMQDPDKIKIALNELSKNMGNQSTLWYATPFALIFLTRIFEKALSQSDINNNAFYIVERLLEIFSVIAESFCEGERLEHPKPLPLFEDMLKEEYLWSEVYNEDDDLLRYEEDSAFPDNLFYSFYYYSFEVLRSYRKEFEKLKNTKFEERARGLCLLFMGIN